ncbi:thioesterase II family protein [Streptomyces sp. NPDC015171]|uniref:thioesterase II family protein n=1 Tax=Streptomyces sp. NPDC015171 TaxID=3364945 RepID=UPI0036FC330C
MSGPGSWFDNRFRRAGASATLYCFPFAGGTAAYYAPWAEEFTAAVEIVPVQPPGRGSRMAEPGPASIAEMADTLAPLIAAAPTRPLLLGHSMGAITAFEVARRLAVLGRPAGTLFVSGRPAPPIARPVAPVSGLPRNAFVRMLRAYGTAPEEVLGHAELLDVLLPMIRADFDLIERYAYAPGPPLDCPVLAWCGDADPEVRPADMARWGEQTTGPFELTVLPGGHFFLTDHHRQIVKSVLRTAA